MSAYERLDGDVQSFPRTVKAQFTSNDDPGFQLRPSAQACADELRRYPRSARHTPDWLRRGAEG